MMLKGSNGLKKLLSLFGLLSVLLSLVAQSVAADDVQLDTIYQIPAEVRYMAIVGPWQKSVEGQNLKGLVRLSITKFKKRNRIYLQWLQGEEIVSTVGIDEINQDLHFRVTLPKIAKDSDQPEVSFTLEDLHSRLLYLGQLKVLCPGSYSFEHLLID